MDSFMSRKARQSPLKVREAEKAFIKQNKKKNGKQARLLPPRDSSNLGIRLANNQTTIEHPTSGRNF